MSILKKMKNLKIDTSKIQDLETAIQIIEFLLEENRQLKKRIIQLEEKVAELSKNSSNSSKPPSSDITKPPKKRKQQGKRKQGAQKGHKGVQFKPFPPEKIDFIKELELCKCPDCNQPLSKDLHPKILTQQVVELPEKPVIITEYKRLGRLCSNCQNYYYPQLPAGVTKNQLLGCRIQSLVAYMKGNLYASYSGLEDFFRDVLNVSVSRGLLEKTICRVSKSLKLPYQELGSSLRKQDILHVDETGWREKGKKLWAWIFCNPKIAYFKIDKSRGSKVLYRILGESFEGSITSDFFSAYVKFANPFQQFCLAHLIRDIKFLTTLKDQETRDFGTGLLEKFTLLFDVWHKKEHLTSHKLSSRLKKQKKSVRKFLFEKKAPLGKASTLSKRLLKHWDSIFRFIFDPDRFEPTNNLAERTIRPIVISRRHSQGSCSYWGRMWSERIMSVLGTCKKQSRSSWNFLCQATRAYSQDDTPPSLLPDFS